MTPALGTPPLFAALAGARNVLVAGAGGGFDVYAGLPLTFALRAAGTTVHLANLSFTELELIDPAAWVAPELAAIGPDTTGPDDYFPERTLARWLGGHDMPAVVHAFPRTGVEQLRAAYRALIDRHHIDAVVLVDGGTDILMRGDEAGMGTPEEDMTSLAAVAGIAEVGTRLVTCLGFGIDAYHGVNHVQVLENLAALDQAGHYLGCLSIPGGSDEARLYREAVAHAQRATPLRPSIVQGQIAAALAGECGDVRFTSRTAGSTLFVNPLMAMYFSVDLAGLAARNLYLERLEHTLGMSQVAMRIERFRDEVRARTPRTYPH